MGLRPSCYSLESRVWSIVPGFHGSGFRVFEASGCDSVFGGFGRTPTVASERAPPTPANTPSAEKVNGSSSKATAPPVIASPPSSLVWGSGFRVWWYCLSSSLLGPVDPSFRALSGRRKFTVRRHKFNRDSISVWFMASGFGFRI